LAALNADEIPKFPLCANVSGGTPVAPLPTWKWRKEAMLGCTSRQPHENSTRLPFVWLTTCTLDAPVCLDGPLRRPRLASPDAAPHLPVGPGDRGGEGPGLPQRSLRRPGEESARSPVCHQSFASVAFCRINRGNAMELSCPYSIVFQTQSKK